MHHSRTYFLGICLAAVDIRGGADAIGDITLGVKDPGPPRRRPAIWRPEGSVVVSGRCTPNPLHCSGLVASPAPPRWITALKQIPRTCVRFYPKNYRIPNFPLSTRGNGQDARMIWAG